MKEILIREAYDWLYYGSRSDLTKREAEELIDYLQRNYQNQNVVEYADRKLRFINLVGVIQLQTVRIEILPKISVGLSDVEKDRLVLLNMLAVTRKLPVHLDAETLSSYQNVNVLHVFVHVFIKELYKALKRGLYREYCTASENMDRVKGRLLVSRHIQKNAFSPIHAFCEFDELSLNVVFNQVLKAAVKLVYPYVQQQQTKVQVLMILELLQDVEDVYLSPHVLDTIRCNRQNEHYNLVIRVAIAILKSSAMNTNAKHEVAFSFLFKMNDLFEGYVGEILKRTIPSSKMKVDAQHTEKRLLLNVNSGRENILLKPDYVLSLREEGVFLPKIIIDTKWKNILSGQRVLYQQSDIYQMYAYVTAYQSVQRCILLYPYTEEGVLPKWLVPHAKSEKYIEVNTIRLDSIQHSLEDVAKIVDTLCV